MNLELNDLQADVLTHELQKIIQNDRYPLSPRIVILNAIVGQLRLKPERKLLGLMRRIERPSKGRDSRRR